MLAALRALCTSANTDVVLLCGAWQMRAHSEVLRARSHALAQMLATSDGQQARAIVKLRLNMDPGALGIAVNYMYFNEVRSIGNPLFLLISITKFFWELHSKNYFLLQSICISVSTA